MEVSACRAGGGGGVAWAKGGSASAGGRTSAEGSEPEIGRKDPVVRA